MTLYEGMFLLDNDVVRAGWDSAKGAVTETLEKHGGTIRTARRWGERKLARNILRSDWATKARQLTHNEVADAMVII